MAELLITAAERRPADDWRLLGRLCGETRTRLTMIVEQPASDRHVATLGGDVRELTLAELVAQTPPMPEDPWGLFDWSWSPDGRPGYPPVPDIDFRAVPERVQGRATPGRRRLGGETFAQARRATTLRLELRRGIEASPPEPTPRARVPGQRSSLRASPSTARSRFCAARRRRRCSTGSCSRSTPTRSRSITRGTPARRRPGRRRGRCAAIQSRTLAAAGALPCATRANPAQIAGLTLAAVTPVDASLASGHRIALAFQSLLDAQRLARDAGGDEPLFLASDGVQPAAARHIQRWLGRISRETGLRFESSSGWNRYTTRRGRPFARSRSRH